MKIAEHKVVSLNYTLKNSEGQLLDTSEGREPLVYLHGVGALIPGLEKQLEGKEKGNHLDAVVAPEEAYGSRVKELVQVVPKAGFQSEGGEELIAGMQVQVQTNEGVRIANVTKIDGEDVTLDLNHPLADVELHFSVDVLEIREAEKEEIEQKQVKQA